MTPQELTRKSAEVYGETPVTQEQILEMGRRIILLEDTIEAQHKQIFELNQCVICGEMDHQDGLRRDGEFSCMRCLPESHFVDVVLSGPPGPESDFVEVENLDGKSVLAGKWIDRGNGLWALRLQLFKPPESE